MSKITDALYRAEEQRRTQGTPDAQLFRRIRSEAPEPAIQLHGGPEALIARQIPGSWSGSGPAVKAAAISSPVAPANGTAAADDYRTPSNGDAATATWEAAIERVTQQLAAIEARVSRGAGERVRLKAQLEANEQLVASIGQEQIQLKQQLASVEQALRAVDTDRAACVRQLESLRECQMLSHTVRITEQELAANTAALETIARTQQHVREEQAHYQQRAQALEQQLEGFRFRLAQSLAFTGTTDARTAGGGAR